MRISHGTVFNIGTAKGIEETPLNITSANIGIGISRDCLSSILDHGGSQSWRINLGNIA